MRTLIILVFCAFQAVTAAKESFHTTPPPIPRFSCSGRPMGYYADAETNCRAYHMCDDHGNHFAHYCPEDTAFRQDAMVCDHAYLVDCQASIDNASRRAKLDQDKSHEAVSSEFVEPRGEGTNNRGFARSFRIKPDSKSTQDSKYPTFVLNSSVFLTDRNNSPKSTSSPNSFSSKESQRESFKASETSNNFNKADSSSSFFRPLQSSSTNVAPSTTLASISEELLPPTESLVTSKVYGDVQDDEYSFLIPPSIRDDNTYFQKSSFESLKNKDSRFPKFDFKPSSVDNFQTDSFEMESFEPETKMVFGMMKAKSLANDLKPSFSITKPSNLLEPPFFKSTDFPHARSNFNFHTDDYPYVETLRSIQNNKAGNFANLMTRSTFSEASSNERSTEAAIIPAPTKPLLSATNTENDPYYPRTQSTTEAFFTPRQRLDKFKKHSFGTTRRPSMAKIEIPAVLPDLNSLEDLLDRRKYFFIPKAKAS